VVHFLSRTLDLRSTLFHNTRNRFPRFTGLWCNPDFMKLWTGQTVSEFGSVVTRDALPLVAESATLHEALLEILRRKLGMTTVVDASGRLAGVLTDGDLKRILLRGAFDMAQPVSAVMSRTPRTIEAGALVAQAVRRMEENEGGAITSLVVTGARGEPIGVLHLHDCLGTPRERR